MSFSSLLRLFIYMVLGKNWGRSLDRCESPPKMDAMDVHDGPLSPFYSGPHCLDKKHYPLCAFAFK
jgi:hypothetical protein